MIWFVKVCFDVGDSESSHRGCSLVAQAATLAHWHAGVPSAQLPSTLSLATTLSLTLRLGLVGGPRLVGLGNAPGECPLPLFAADYTSPKPPLPLCTRLH